MCMPNVDNDCHESSLHMDSAVPWHITLPRVLSLKIPGSQIVYHLYTKPDVRNTYIMKIHNSNNHNANKDS